MKLSHYEWDPEKDLIAEGGFAEVFKAKDINTSNRWVALKIYKEAVSRGTTGDSTGQKKYSLEQEFAKIDGLSHTNIITFYGLEYIEHKDAMGRTASYPVLIMEYAGEGTLKELSIKNLSENDLEEIIVGVIRATGYLHTQGVIHRDLKPGNVLFSKDRNGKLVAKITDFGISKDTLGDKTIEQSFTEGIGTPHYMAPEQFFKKKFGLNGEVSERTDIWAIGVIIYQLLIRKRPFGHGIKDYELIRDEITQKELDLTDVPEKYKNIISACLQKEAGNRADSATELLKLLEPEVEDEDITIIPGIANPSSRTVMPRTKPESKTKLIKYAITGLLIAVLGFSGFKWYQNSQANELLSTAWDYYKSGMFKEAYNTYSDASSYNSGKAYYYLALMNEQGRGTVRDYKKSQKYADQAINLGYDMAAFYQGDMHKYGWGVPVDSVRAVEYYKQSLSQVKKLADKEDVEAMHLYGLLLVDPTLKMLDSAKSFEMINKSADKGHPIAKSNLASWNQLGIGTKKNCREALKLFTEGLDINFDRSINGLGNLYFSGCDDVAQDYEKALEYYKIAAKQNNILAQNSIGYIYQYGKGKIPVDLDEALVWYTRAADGDHIPAFNNLGTIYQKKKNFQKAREWYLKAAMKNNAYGAYNLGNLFLSDEYAKKDIDSSNYWHRKASLLGHVGAQVQLGYAFYIGRGMKKNLDSAFYWYNESAIKNYKGGQYRLGLMYENGDLGEKNYTKAKEWYEKAAAQDYAVADFAIGNLYYNGKGFPKDYSEAGKWYKKGAEKGNSSCQYMIGYMYEKGQGKGKNYYTARDWYRKAALQNHTNAQTSLGNLYYNGNIGKDYKKAFYWTEKAAKSGNTFGQHNLGLYYYYGIGKPKSKKNAKYWFTQACNKKYANSCKMLKEYF